MTGAIRWLYDISQKRRNDTVQELWKLYQNLEKKVESLERELHDEKRTNDILRHQNQAARLICTNACWQKIDSLPASNAAPAGNVTPET